MNKKMWALIASFTLVATANSVAQPSKFDYIKPLSKIALGVGLVGFDILKHVPESGILGDSYANPLPKYFKEARKPFKFKNDGDTFACASLISRVTASAYLINQGYNDIQTLNKKSSKKDSAPTATVQQKFFELYESLKQALTK